MVFVQRRCKMRTAQRPTRTNSDQTVSPQRAQRVADQAHLEAACPLIGFGEFLEFVVKWPSQCSPFIPLQDNAKEGFYFQTPKRFARSSLVKDPSYRLSHDSARYDPLRYRVGEVGGLLPISLVIANRATAIVECVTVRAAGKSRGHSERATARYRRAKKAFERKYASRLLKSCVLLR